ncbi:MAG: hypothetical protein ACOYNL_01030 [Rickettsiales bacterium]
MKKIIALALVLSLTACEEAPRAYTPAPFAFELVAAQPVMVNVHEVRVVNDYKSTNRRPNVEQEFPVPPAVAVSKWVNQRLKPNPVISANSVLEVVINDASVRETKLDKTKGVKGIFTDDQDARYDVKLSVTFRLFGGGGRGISDATGDVNVTRSRTINEKATVYQREAIYHQMVSDMMVDFDREANARLRTYFAPYLK